MEPTAMALLLVTSFALFACSARRRIRADKASGRMDHQRMLGTIVLVKALIGLLDPKLAHRLLYQTRYTHGRSRDGERSDGRVTGSPLKRP